MAADTDSAQDLYERAGGVDDARSRPGPTAATAPSTSSSTRSRQDGSTVLFEHRRALVAARHRRATATSTSARAARPRCMSTGPPAATAPSTRSSPAPPRDGSHVFFHTDESLVSSDFDAHAGRLRAHRRRHDAPLDRAGGRQRQRRLRLRRVLRRRLGGRVEGVAAHRRGAGRRPTPTSPTTSTSAPAAASRVLSTGPAGGNAELRRILRRRLRGRLARLLRHAGAADGRRHRRLDTTSTSAPGGATTLISTGPDGGNGAVLRVLPGRVAATARGCSSRRPSRCVAADTDGDQDVYQRAGGTTTLDLDRARWAATASFPASFKGASQDGSRVFFDTSENLVAGATGTYPDIYERASGATTFISTGPIGGNGDFFAVLRRARRTTARACSSRPTSRSSAPTPTRPRTSTWRRSRRRLPAAEGRDADARRRWCRPTARARRRTARTGPASPSRRATRPPRSRSHLTVGAPGRERRGGQLGRVREARGAGTGHRRHARRRGRRAGSRSRSPTCGARSDLADYTGQLSSNATLRITDRLNGSVAGRHRHGLRHCRSRSRCRARRDGRHDRRLDLRDHHDGGRGRARHRARDQAHDLAARPRSRVTRRRRRRPRLDAPTTHRSRRRASSFPSMAGLATRRRVRRICGGPCGSATRAATPTTRCANASLFAVQDVDMRRVCVNVKNGALGGAAYNGVPEISNAPRSARYLVTLRLGRGGERWPLGPDQLPLQGARRDRAAQPVSLLRVPRLARVAREAGGPRGQAHRAVPGRAPSAARSTASSSRSSASSSGGRRGDAARGR